MKRTSELPNALRRKSSEIVDRVPSLADLLTRAADEIERLVGEIFSTARLQVSANGDAGATEKNFNTVFVHVNRKTDRWGKVLTLQIERKTHGWVVKGPNFNIEVRDKG